MIMKNGKQIGFIYNNGKKIDKIIRHGKVYFEQGFTREKTDAALPITFGGIGKNLKDYKVYGNTYQNSTSGKNKFAGELYRGGATLLPTGGYSDNANYNIYKLSNIQSGQTYTLSENQVVANIETYTRAIAYDSNNNFVELLYQENRTQTQRYSHTFSLSANTSYVLVSLRISDEQIQLEEGNIATSYEPYTGGQPSPNPDYPQEIVSCGDKSKNLFNKETVKLNYRFGSDGSEYADSWYLASDFIEVNGLEDYIYSRGASGGGSACVCFYDNNKSFISRTMWQGKQNELSILINTPANTKYIRIADAKTLIDSMQVEEGDIATSYEPYYEGYKIPVNIRNDNLFNINSITPNTYITNAGATGSSQSTHLVDYIPVYKDKPIIVSYDYDTLVTTANRSLVFYDTNKNYISGQYYSPIPKIHQFIPKQDGYIRFAYDKNCTNIYISYYNETTNIYLDKPLRKIDEYSDYIDFINGKVVRKIGEVILDGTEAWRKSSKTTVNRYSSGSVSDKIINPPLNSISIDLLSDYFTCITPASSDNNSIGLAKLNNYGLMANFELTDTNFDTLEKFVSWLSSNNVIVDYVLETPIEENIELPNIPTIDGNNTLNIETEITPSQVYIKYKSNN